MPGLPTPEDLGGLLPLLAAAAVTAGILANVVSRLLPTLPFLVRGEPVNPGVTPPPQTIPRLGGVAIFVGIAAACALGMVVRWTEWSAAVPREEFLALAIGTGIIFLVGLVDDLVGVTPVQKFVVQIVAAWLVVRVGWEFKVVNVPGFGSLDLGLWGGVVSIVWIVGVTNAINLIDGLDGLAGGVASIIALSLLVYSLIQGNEGTSILLAAVVGACLGFLWHNWEPARVYMGDSGSLTLGFLFASISLHASLKAPAAVAILVPILALGLPVIDTLLVMIFRFAEGEGRSLVRRFARMFHADMHHLHHLLGHLVTRRSRIVVLLYLVVSLFCVGALWVALTGEPVFGLILLAVEVAAVFAMRRLGLAAQVERLALTQREEARRTLEGWDPVSALQKGREESRTTRPES